MLDLDALTQARDLLADCANASVWSLTDTDLVRVVRAAHAAAQLATAVTAHVVQEIDGRGLATALGATCTAVWLRGHLRIEIREAKQLIMLAADLHHRPVLDTTLCTGAINIGQARAIAAVLRDLPDHVDPLTRAAAEARLLTLAADWEPHALRRCGARVLSHVAPEFGRPGG